MSSTPAVDHLPAAILLALHRGGPNAREDAALLLHELTEALGPDAAFGRFTAFTHALVRNLTRSLTPDEVDQYLNMWLTASLTKS